MLIILFFNLKIILCLHKIAINYLLSPFYMLFFHLYYITFSCFFCFPLYDNVYPKFKKGQSMKSDFIFENCYKRMGFSKENSCYLMKDLKKKKRFAVAWKQTNRKYTWSL